MPPESFNPFERQVEELSELEGKKRQAVDSAAIIASFVLDARKKAEASGGTKRTEFTPLELSRLSRKIPNLEPYNTLEKVANEDEVKITPDVLAAAKIVLLDELDRLEDRIRTYEDQKRRRLEDVPGKQARLTREQAKVLTSITDELTDLRADRDSCLEYLESLG